MLKHLKSLNKEKYERRHAGLHKYLISYFVTKRTYYLLQNMKEDMPECRGICSLVKQDGGGFKCESCPRTFPAPIKKKKEEG